jgi:hypothetical protein
LFLPCLVPHLRNPDNQSVACLFPPAEDEPQGGWQQAQDAGGDGSRFAGMKFTVPAA